MLNNNIHDYFTPVIHVIHDKVLQPLYILTVFVCAHTIRDSSYLSCISCTNFYGLYKEVE